ncbi:MAG: hypothetical protein ACSHWW_05615 [Nonlabens sp.]|uniref:hypothetical protein n=1 Tax=Nonlabens sp. TaxID=1888209 RepID=UPI003EF71B78
MRFALTYGGIEQQEYTTQSLSLQFNYEQELNDKSFWSYRFGLAYARGFERTGFTDTRNSRLNEYTAQSSLNYNLGNKEKVDIQLGVGPFLSIISGNSDRFTGESNISPALPAEDFNYTKFGIQGILRLSWFGVRNTHSLMIFTKFSSDFYSAYGFGYEIGI